MSEGFEHSADMRLLMWQREAMGLAGPAATSWRSDSSLESASALVAEAAPQYKGALVSLAASGTPAKGLIPGAVVTLAVALHNEGADPARGVSLRAPLPGAVRYRPGTLQIDQVQRPDHEIEPLTGTGLPLGDLEPGQRIGVTFKADVRPGVDPLVFAPSAQARAGAVVAGRPVLLARAAPGAGSAFIRAVAEQTEPASPLSEAAQPFYELDEEESLVYDAADTALSDARREAPSEPALPAPLAEIPPAEIRQAEIPPAATLPKAPAQPAAPLGQGVLISNTIDSATLALLRRLLGGKGLGLLPHFVIANALACSRVRGAEEIDLAGYFAAENSRLQRALVQRRLGRAVRVSDVAGAVPDVGQLDDRAARLTIDDLPRSPRGVTLFSILSAADVDFLKRAAIGDDASAFIRARQFAIALLAHAATTDGSGDERAARALAAYAALLKARINALFVKLKISAQASPLGSEDADADLAGASLLDALSALALA